MYEATFKLTQRPFLAVPRVDRYFPAATIEAARQNLSRVVERAEGPGLLIGPAGTGKSLLCEVLAEQFEGQFQVAHFSSARLCTRKALLQAILYELGLPYREMEEGELRLSLIDHLDPTNHAGDGMLFLIDEAHALPLRLLEEIRMISNLVRDGQPRVRLVLAGSPALEERFASPKLESFNQRVAARCYLDAFNAHDTYQYVCAQLQACGGDAHQLFADNAFEAIYRATGGVPRLVNQVCDHVLVLACAGGVKQIDAAGVEEAWSDLQQLPLPWQSGVAASPKAASSVVEFGSLDDDLADSSGPYRDEEDDRPAAVPFPRRANHVMDSLDEVEEHVAELEDEFEPVGTIGPEVELRFDEPFNPFAESFEEEEVVIDRYAQLDDAVLRNRPRVDSRGGDGISELLRAHAVPAPQPKLAMTAESDEHFDAVLPEVEPPQPAPRRVAPAAQVVASVTTEATVTREEHEILVIEDDPVSIKPAPRVRRQEYRQLFAKLRQG